MRPSVTGAGSVTCGGSVTGGGVRPNWLLRPMVAAATVAFLFVCGVTVLAVLQVPPYDTLGSAIADLGPVAGWRCAESGSYVYDPRRGRPDAALVVQTPDDVVRAAAPGVEVQRVEVDLRSGEAVAWTEDAAGAQRVFVLLPGRVSGVSLNRAGTLVQICDSHLANWQIVEDHFLGQEREPKTTNADSISVPPSWPYL